MKKDLIKDIILTIVFIVFLLIGFAAGYWFAPGKIIKGDTIVQHDTSYIIVHQKPDTIIKKANIVKTVIKSDTLILSNNADIEQFIAYDTLLTRKDTINIAFFYPGALFRYEIFPAPDSIKIIESVREKIRYAPEQRPLWLDIASHTGAAVIAVGLLSIIKR